MPGARNLVAACCVFCCLVPVVRAPAAARDPASLDTVLAHQRANGGWPKNYDRSRRLGDAERTQLAAERHVADTTIDNGATHSEIRLLAAAAADGGGERVQQAALLGIDYLLAGQYPNGGWPQQFPDAKGYSVQITFNDNAFMGVMNLLHDVATSRPDFAFVPADVRVRCQEAVARGIDCILACQVVRDGRPTVWCAQHDRETLRPCHARSFELPSLSGGESVGVVRFLMRLERPTPEIVAAIEGAVAWFERARIEGLKVSQIPAADTPRGYDVVLEPAPGARDLWARFYDLDTGRPFVCGRDGVPRARLADIPYERRVGYSWYGSYARELLAEDLPRWRERLGR